MSEDNKISFDGEPEVEEYVIRHRDLNSLEDIKKISDPPPRQAPAPLDRGNSSAKWNLGEEVKARFADNVDIEKVFNIIKKVTAIMLSVGIIIGLVFIVKWVFLVFEPNLQNNKPAPTSSEITITQQIGTNYYG